MAGDCDDSFSPKMASRFDELSRSRSDVSPREGALGVSSLSYDLREEIIAGRSIVYKFGIYSQRKSKQEEPLVCRRTSRRTNNVTTSVDDG